MAMTFQVDNCCDCGVAPPPKKDCLSVIKPNGATVLGSFQPPPNGYIEATFQGSGGAGRYVLYYCGGAVEVIGYGEDPRPGFVANSFYFTTTPANVDPDWSDVNPQWIKGNCLALRYGKNGPFVDTFFSSGISGATQTTPEAAANALIAAVAGTVFGGGPLQYEILNDGTAPITIQWTVSNKFITVSPFGNTGLLSSEVHNFQIVQSPQIPPIINEGVGLGALPGSGDPPTPPDENIPDAITRTPDPPLPTFTLVKLTPNIIPKGCCSFPQIVPPAGRYILILTFHNATDYQWSGVANLAMPSGSITSGQGQNWTANPQSDASVAFNVTIGSKVQTATLTLLDRIGTVIGSFRYDTTPILTGVTITSLGTSAHDSNRNVIQVSFSGANGFEISDLRAFINLSPQITGVFRADDGTPQNPVDSAVPGFPGGLSTECGTFFGIQLEISLSSHHPGSVPVNGSWYEGGSPSAGTPGFGQSVNLIWT